MAIPNDCFRIHGPVAETIRTGRPVVALESAFLTHGLPAPTNWETMCGLLELVNAAGAMPAVVGVVNGRVRVGLTTTEIRNLAERPDSAKVNLANLAPVVCGGGWGGTTVSATLYLARKANIRVLATGGIGGIHRRFPENFDLSADLTALSRCPLVVVCAGMKSLLDLPRTVELLETLGVPVVGYGTRELPAFYSAHSGLGLDHAAASPQEIARLARCHWELSGTSSLMVTVPVPAAAGLDPGEMETLVRQAEEEAARRKIRGPRLTPFLLKTMDRLSGGRCLQANLALLRNNAAVAAAIARALCFPNLP